MTRFKCHNNALPLTVELQVPEERVNEEAHHGKKISGSKKWTKSIEKLAKKSRTNTLISIRRVLIRSCRVQLNLNWIWRSGIGYLFYSPIMISLLLQTNTLLEV